MARPEEILAYWFGPPRPDDAPMPRDIAAKWFMQSDATDDYIRTTFGADVERAARGDHDNWALTPRGRMALLILLDQFTRNIYRNDPRAFACDPKAQALTRDGINMGVDLLLGPYERAFFYLPLEHSEGAADQELCVIKYRELRAAVAPALAADFDSFLDYAERHKRVIDRFGRFPHRNDVLGRPTTNAERDFLALGKPF